jgi:hypothetical protein
MLDAGDVDVRATAGENLALLDDLFCELNRDVSFLSLSLSFFLSFPSSPDSNITISSF